MSKIQGVLFDPNGPGRTVYPLYKAEEWIQANGLVPIKVSMKKRYWRIRIRDPQEFARIRTKKIDDGIELLIGFH